MAAFRISQIIGALALGLTASGIALAGETAADGPVVVELFTSQSCYSCPPAEAYLGELAERDDLIALEFHVDYWDDLVYGAAGRWKDPFSDPAYTRRQQVYARRIPGGRVYTPQMVVDGRLEAVGSRRGDVQRSIAAARAEPGREISLSLVEAPGTGLRVDLAGAVTRPVNLWLVGFERSHVTRVQAGENKGKTLANHHVVTALQQVGSWTGGPMSLAVEPTNDGPNRGCAILAQEANQGPILAAAYCPTGKTGS